MISINIENLASNHLYVRNLIKKHNPSIICLQETWLFTFQNKKIEELFPEYEYVARSVDEDDPLPPYKLPRGYGGVAILWKKNISNLCTPQLDGTNRMNVLSIGEHTIINVYMPCRGGKYLNQDYYEEVDSLHEVISKYKNSKIVLAGDMNINDAQNDARAKYFRKLISDHKLSEAKQQALPTIAHHNGKDSNRIDYIFLDDKWDTTNASYEVDDDVTNTSSHRALILKIQTNIDEGVPKNKTITRGRLNWKKADLDDYRHTLAALLDPTIECASSDLATSYLIEALTLATEKSVPVVKPKTKQAPWSGNIQKLLLEGRAIAKGLKLNDDPEQTGKLHQARKELKKKFRQAQRRENASQRNKLHQDIMDASSGDSQLFFRIIRKQRSSMSRVTKELVLDDVTYTEDLADIWAMHFSKLATPTDSSKFDSEYAKQVEEDIIKIEDTARKNLRPLSIPITDLEVNEAIGKLKLNKAKDEYDLTAEHLRNARDEIVPFLTQVINVILNEARMPNIIKGGVLRPILKKNNKYNIPTNYRGITITAIIGKVLDYIHLKHQKVAIHNQHRLQFGFIEGRACTGAALLLSEAIYESKDNKQPLYVGVLDVAKAFDVVYHPSLLRKLHIQGLRENWWLLKQDMLKGMYSRVLWQNELSNKFTILQGNRQGAYGSPNEYLSYQYDELDMLDSNRSGTYIGAIHVPAPTCADDTVLLANHIHDLQSQLLITENYSKQERFELQITKTSITNMNSSSPENENIKKKQPWSLNEEKVSVTDEFTHLGIQRANEHHPSGTRNDPAIVFRLTLARRTTNALMGVGWHGMNGLPPALNIQLYKVFVIPRFTYGLEAIKIRNVDYTDMEKQHRSLIRNILHLPTRTAIPALHIISSVLPIQAIIEEKTLKFLRSCLVNPGILQDIIIRQHAMKDSNSNSWVVYMEKMLEKYKLPTIMEMYEESPTKESWKKLVKEHVQQKWKEVLEEIAESKSTLKHMNLNPSFSQQHHSIECITNLTQASRVNIKLRLMTGTYSLQTVRAYTYKQIPSPKCLLCDAEEETLHHFILQCPALHKERDHHLKRILESIPEDHEHKQRVTDDEQLLLQLIIDPTHPNIKEWLLLPKDKILEVENLTQAMTFALHHRRSTLQNTCNLC